MCVVFFLVRVIDSYETFVKTDLYFVSYRNDLHCEKKMYVVVLLLSVFIRSRIRNCLYFSTNEDCSGLVLESFSLSLPNNQMDVTTSTSRLGR